MDSAEGEVENRGTSARYYLSVWLRVDGDRLNSDGLGISTAAGLFSTICSSAMFEADHLRLYNLTPRSQTSSRLTYNCMVVRYREPHGLDDVLHALADPTRRNIIVNVLRKEQSVSSLAGRYPMTFAAVQKHVAVLEAADLVVKRRNGREQLVRANIETIRRTNRLFDQLENLWRDRITQMSEILAEPKGK